MKVLVMASSMLALVAIGASVANTHGLKQTHKHTPNVAQDTKTLTASTYVNAMVQAAEQVTSLMDSGDYTSAEAIVDQNLSDTGFGTFMAVKKAELLAKRSANTASLNMYMDVIHGTYGPWMAESRQLRVPMDLAVSLGRDSDADEIATAIIAHQSNGFYGDDNTGSLEVPTTATNASTRKAYAFLVLATDSGFDRDSATELSYCQAASAILPTSTIVLVHTAHAYIIRNQTGDLDTGKALLTQAYDQEASGSSTRTEIQEIATSFGFGDLT